MFGNPEEMLLRWKVSSRYEVTGSQTSGCQSDDSSDSPTICCSRRGREWEVGQWLGDLTSTPAVVYSWTSSTWAQEEVCEGVSPTSEGSKGTGKTIANFQTQSWTLVVRELGCSVLHTPPPTHLVWHWAGSKEPGLGPLPCPIACVHS